MADDVKWRKDVGTVRREARAASDHAVWSELAQTDSRCISQDDKRRAAEDAYSSALDRLTEHIERLERKLAAMAPLVAAEEGNDGRTP